MRRFSDFLETRHTQSAAIAAALGGGDSGLRKIARAGRVLPTARGSIEWVEVMRYLRLTELFEKGGYDASDRFGTDGATAD